MMMVPGSRMDSLISLCGSTMTPCSSTCRVRVRIWMRMHQWQQKLCQCHVWVRDKSGNDKQANRYFHRRHATIAAGWWTMLLNQPPGMLGNLSHPDSHVAAACIDAEL